VIFKERDMIYFMPFTHISTQQVSELAQVLDKLAVLQPVSGLTAEMMRSWQHRGFLELRRPAELDEKHLNRVLSDFKQWSDNHKPGIGHLSGYFKTSAKKTAMLDETAPNQIRTQIQRFERNPSRSENDWFLQAALFLAMAQQYDANQDGITQELGSILEMEKQMVAQLAGQTDDLRQALSSSRSMVYSSTAIKDPGTYMTQERVHSWACLALSDPGPIHALVTTSAAVWEYLRDTLPEPTVLFNRQIEPEPDASQSPLSELKQQVCRTFEDIAFSNDPAGVCVDALSRISVRGGLRKIVIYTLAKCPLVRTLSSLAQSSSAANAGASVQHAPNTVIGFFEHESD
jgi:hypothetical protein